MRLLATIALLALGLAAGCGGDDEEPAAEQPTATTQTEPQPPSMRLTVEPEVPRPEQAAAAAVVSRYADALQNMDFGRACALLAPSARKAGAGACAAELERFARGSDVLRLARTVPLWDSGAVDAGTGAIRGRVKIGFPAQPETRWVFSVVREPGERWRVGAPLPQVGQAGQKSGQSGP